MSAKILTVTLAVDNSAFQEKQIVEWDVSALGEDDPFIIALKQQWAKEDEKNYQVALKQQQDLFALG